MAGLTTRLGRRQLLRAAGTIGGIGLFGSQPAGARQRDPLDRYIVGVDRGRADVARRAAASVYRVLDFGRIGQVVSGWYPEEALRGLRANPHVRYVEAEGEMHAIGETLPWGIDRVDAEVAHGAGETGSGASLAVIDTGIDQTHEDLTVSGGRNFVDCSDDDDGAACADEWGDGHGHGTHCSGIANADDNETGVVGTSTDAAHYAVRVLDDDGSGTYSDIAAGIRWTADTGIDVGSLSLGGGDSQVVEDACTYAKQQGTLLVAAAGNDGSHPVFSTVSYPAAYSTVVAVSATDETDDIASFSSRGPEVDLAAPGVDVLSTLPGNSYDRWSGTSMACPHVSGAGAQLMATGATHVEARDQLFATAEDVGLGSREQGNGLVDVAAALGYDSSDDLSEGNSAPSVSWNAPSDGATVSGSVDVDVSAGDSDGSIHDVEWKYDGGSYTTISDGDGDGTYDDTWDSTSVSDGTYTLSARATDDDGGTVGGSVTLQIDASDDDTPEGELTVEYEVDDSGNWLGTTYDSDTGYHEATWDTTAVQDGEHVLDARATDGSGNTSGEARVTVTVDNTTSAPTGSLGTVTEVNSPNPHAEFDVPWSARDDGTLDSVRLTLTQTSPAVGIEDSATVDVSGGSASGTTTLKAKHDEGRAYDYEVSLTVTDTTGETGGETVSVTEDGR